MWCKSLERAIAIFLWIRPNVKTSDHGRKFPWNCLGCYIKSDVLKRSFFLRTPMNHWASYFIGLLFHGYWITSSQTLITCLLQHLLLETWIIISSIYWHLSFNLKNGFETKTRHLFIQFIQMNVGLGKMSSLLWTVQVLKIVLD